MKPPHTLATTTTGIAALALALAGPGTALAQGGPPEGRGAGHGGETSAAATPEQSASHRGAPASSQGHGASTGQGASASQGASAIKGASASKGGPRDGRGDGPGDGQGGGQAAAGDPAGNNGTIKIGALPLSGTRGNQPHVGCEFALLHYGFDADQTADITFTHHAPTGSGDVLLAQSGIGISEDAAGGGQDDDAVLTYTAEQLGLTGTAPHRQGWHVKVTVDALEAPGGAKQKVFWIDCPADVGAGGGGTGDTGDTGGTDDTSGGSSLDDQDGQGSDTESDVDVLSSVFGAPAPTARTGASVGVLAAGLGGGAGAGAAGALAGAAPTTLPFTGAGSLGALLAAAAGALASGAAALRAGRRRG